MDFPTSLTRSSRNKDSVNIRRKKRENKEKKLENNVDKKEPGKKPEGNVERKGRNYRGANKNLQEWNPVKNKRYKNGKDDTNKENLRKQDQQTGEIVNKVITNNRFGALRHKEGVDSEMNDDVTHERQSKSEQNSKGKSNDQLNNKSKAGINSNKGHKQEDKELQSENEYSKDCVETYFGKINQENTVTKQREMTLQSQQLIKRKEENQQLE
ncbi:hypothetical protein K7X08_029792 [Anisodus acutangulus]|uniref:Uncharacterized protein n=1 Tax=Anisodus acutangulus TaxID=402998 RepID=A0A9Q1RHW5_9SOLA|nr:hypothetical protein K7X08_029792 [Anisodus acutangulus]